VAPDGTRLVIKASQVRPEQFRRLVEHYRPDGSTPDRAA
jgi:hypothetical protein